MTDQINLSGIKEDKELLSEVITEDNSDKINYVNINYIDNNIDNNILEVQIPNWKMDIIMKMKRRIKKERRILTFIHIPKCAGSYAAQYIDNLHIINKGHHQATPFDKFSFAIIRHPVDRLESLLNYRLNAPHPRGDWPRRLIDYHYDKSKTLNDVISNMNDSEIISFNPFKTLKYWTKNVRLLITIDEFLPTLKLFEYNIDKLYPTKNISDKNRGKLSIENRDRIERIYNKDMEIYNFWTRL
jgi:hypothetical protein